MRGESREVQKDGESVLRDPLSIEPLRVAAIVNARAGRGLGRRRELIESALRAVHPECACYWPAEEEMAGLVRGLLKDGVERIVSVGGDGTHAKVANGFLDGGKLLNPEAHLAPIPLGTGNDLCRMLGSRSSSAPFDVLRNGQLLQLDLGQLDYTDPTGQTARRYFLTTVHLGAGATVCERLSLSGSGGRSAYYRAAVAGALSATPFQAEVLLDGQRHTGRFLDIIIANTTYDGGGMAVAPRARVDSGTLELLAIRELGPARALWHMPKLVRGTLVHHPRLAVSGSSRDITVDLCGLVPVAADGEWLGRGPVHAEVLPGLLSVLGGPMHARQGQGTNSV